MAPKRMFGTGAQPDSPDARDFKVSFDSATESPVDWTNGTSYTCPDIVDQGQSDCCVAAACSYFHWQLKGRQFSRRDLFARIANQTAGQGAKIRDGFTAIVNQGQALLSDLPDPDVETSQNMRNTVGATDEELPWREVNSFSAPNDIDSVARLIALYRGVVMGLYVSVYNWFSVNMEIPDPPTDEQMQNLANEIEQQNVIKHALYFFGFHMHDDGNGGQEKCLLGATSWKWAGTVHHIRKSYFDKQATFCPWTFIPTAAVASVQQNVTFNVGGAGAAEVQPKRPRIPTKPIKTNVPKKTGKNAAKKVTMSKRKAATKKAAAKSKTQIGKR
jgi:hypothetical protein